MLGHKGTHVKSNVIIGEQIMEYSNREKYLSHYITDDNSFVNSVILDLNKRASSVPEELC